MFSYEELYAVLRDSSMNLQEGNIDMSFDGWITFGIRHRWGNNPTFYFIKSVINKWVYRFPLEGGMEGEIASDTRFVLGQVKAHLGLYKFKVKGAEGKILEDVHPTEHPHESHPTGGGHDEQGSTHQNIIESKRF